MKYNSARYSTTAALGTLAISAMCNAASHEPTKWLISVFGSMFVALACHSVIPYHDRGD